MVMRTDLMHACLPPDRDEIYRLLDLFENAKYTENYIVSLVMKHFRGRCNPVLVREIVSEYLAARPR